MKPGRELDALIAQKVMGITMFTATINSFSFPDEGPLVWHEPKPYSIDIAAAWEVVQEMEKKQREPGKWGGFNITSDDHGWCAAFWRQWSFGSSAPHAICLAALKALGEKP